MKTNPSARNHLRSCAFICGFILLWLCAPAFAQGEKVDAYVEAMFQSEGHQLNAFVNFIKTAKLDAHLRAKRWARFAEGYNGPAYAENQYDKKLEAAYEKYRRLATA